ncbi:MAG: aminotransferase class III-fold pyridoxal phosphate-dependent enzyme [Homoserinimonas sp.]
MTTVDSTREQHTPAAVETSLERAKRLFPPASARHTDLAIDRALGAYVWTEDGRKIIDFASGVAVTNVGHNNPTVLAAAKAQMETMIHVGHNVALCPPYLDLAERLVPLVGPDRKIFFANSGAEALEAGIKLAMHTSGRSGLIAFKRAFHGRTLAMTGLSASSSKYRSGYLGALPAVQHVDFPAPFVSGLSEEAEVERCLAQLDETFALLLPPGETAAIVVEPVQGEGGYTPAPAAFLQGLKERADKHGIALIFDEIQSGFGRTGKMFAFEHSGVVPDIIALAKGIANGFPLSAMAARTDLMDKWPAGAHGGTFGGNPVACASALAVIDVLQGGALQNAEKIGQQLRAGLEQLAASTDYRTDVRGLGIMIGVEFRNEDGTAASAFVRRVCAEALNAGVLILSCGTEGNVLRVMPPTTLTSEEATEALRLLQLAFDAAR